LLRDLNGNGVVGELDVPGERCCDSEVLYCEWLPTWESCFAGGTAEACCNYQCPATTE
jgi:hypothetical protein